MMNPPSQWPPQPRPKGGHGCLIAIAVIAGLVFVGAIAIALIAWRFSQSATGQQAFAPAKMVLQAQSAPGTRELRGIGCQTATVLDLRAFGEALSHASTFDAGATTLPVVGKQVGCRLALVGKKPSCDEVAASYAETMGGRVEGGLDVQVLPAVGLEPVCHETYDERGARLSAKP